MWIRRFKVTNDKGVSELPRMEDGLTRAVEVRKCCFDDLVDIRCDSQTGVKDYEGSYSNMPRKSQKELQSSGCEARVPSAPPLSGPAAHTTL